MSVRNLFFFAPEPYFVLALGFSPEVGFQILAFRFGFFLVLRFFEGEV